MIRYVLFRAFQLIGVLMLLPLVTALIYRERQEAAIFALVLCAFFLIGTAGSLKKPENRVFFARDGFVMTALIWLLISAAGAVPFMLTGTIPSFVDAFFETSSGFTTTGATILTSVEGMAKSVQFWRCFTHWIGGMGVLVFMLAVLPLTGGSTMHLMRAESPGPSVGKIVPRVKNTAKLLYRIYIGITVIQVVLLMLTGLSLYEALTATFSTVGTGGFGIADSSANLFPVSSQIVITVFMTLCGINFNVYYFLLVRKPGEAFKCEEVRWYLAVMILSAAVIAPGIYRAGLTDTPFLSFHHALFSVSSVMTTTGFATLDFNLWPQYARTLLFLLMISGACAGSTGGGFKFSRLLILARRLKNEMVFATHQKSIRQVYLDGRRVEGTTVKSVTAYLGIYIAVYLVSFFLISLDGFDFETNMTAVAATLNNVGPGLSMVGPVGNYSAFSPFAKLVLSFDMIAGRLELLPMLMLFRRRTWKGQ